MRSIARALALAAHGHPVTAVGIQRTACFVHVTADLRARRGAPPRARVDVAFAGLAGLGLTALAAGTAALTTDAATASAISAAAWLAFALDLAPWLRTDTRDLLGIWTRVPGLGRGAVRYISSAIAQRGAVSMHERALRLAAVVGVVHPALVAALVAGGGLPGLVQRSIRFVYAPALADGGAFERGLTLGLTAVVTGAVILLVVGMTRELSRVVRAVVRPRPSAAAGTAANLTADQRASIAATEPITFVLRALNPDVRHEVLAAFEARAFEVGDRVTVQGDPIRRAGVVLSGALDRSRRTDACLLRCGGGRGRPGRDRVDRRRRAARPRARAG